MQVYQDWARVIESGEPLGGATITVYDSGTLDLASLFSDDGVTPLANPFTADAVTGIFAFYAADGLYDITITAAGATSYTLSAVQLGSNNPTPDDAEYLVGALAAGLTAERVVTNTPTIDWDLATPGEAKADVVSIAGVPGLAADPQDPTAHASEHENGGGDEIDVTGLAGVLAEPQTVAVDADDLTGDGSVGSPLALVSTLARIYRAVVPLNHAQILTLPTTGVQLVAAPGPGKVLCLLGGSIMIDASAGAYTNIETAPDLQLFGALVVYGIGWDRDASMYMPWSGTAEIFWGAVIPTFNVPNAAQLAAVYPNSVFREPLDATYVDSPLAIWAYNGALGDYTGGNAANVGQVVVYYTIEDALT